MRQDWIFSGEGWKCGVRVAGVLVRDGKILLQLEEMGREYAVPGGHIRIGETLGDGLIREWKEETGADVRCAGMLWTEECFWEWNGQRRHNLSFYFLIEPEDEAVLRDDGTIHSHKDNCHILLEWVPIERLEHITVYPEFLKDTVHHLNEPVRHFVTRA